MPLFRRYGRPGLLGGLAGPAVLGGTPGMIGRSVVAGSEVPALDPVATGLLRPDAPPLAEQLKSLIDIHSHGDISDDEFVRAKARLLE